MDIQLVHTWRQIKPHLPQRSPLATCFSRTLSTRDACMVLSPHYDQDTLKFSVQRHQCGLCPSRERCYMMKVKEVSGHDVCVWRKESVREHQPQSCLEGKFLAKLDRAPTSRRFKWNGVVIGFTSWYVCRVGWLISSPRTSTIHHILATTRFNLWNDPKEWNSSSMSLISNSHTMRPSQSHRQMVAL
jgi:hypothetical protein